MGHIRLDVAVEDDGFALLEPLVNLGGVVATVGREKERGDIGVDSNGTFGEPAVTDVGFAEIGAANDFASWGVIVGKRVADDVEAVGREFGC